MTTIERYEELRATGEGGAVRQWIGLDTLDGVEVSLSTTSVDDRNAEAIASLRAEARRLSALGFDVRVFEDLRRGLVGIAYRARTRPGPTQLDARPAPTAHGASAPSPRVRSSLWILALVGVATLVGAMLWLAQRGPGEPDVDEAKEIEASSTKDPQRGIGAPTAAKTEMAKAREGAPEQQPEPGSPCDGVAVSTGCIDRAPVAEVEARGCTTCSPRGRSDEIVLFDRSLDAPIRAELEACRARDGRAVTGGSARCVHYAFAASYCASRGQRVPTQAEWNEGASSGMTTEPALYEWTADVVRERMNWTRGAKGGSQADRNMRAPSLGFRCVR